MESTLQNISNEIAKLVKEFEPRVVAVHARAHYPSSGVHWRPGVIVTADHALRREEDIQLTVSGGKKVSAALAGRDAGTDLAVLKADGLESLAPRAARPEAALGSRVGDLALVLARSPESGLNASLGAVSAVSGPWRTWRGGRLDRYIRLDAKLFPNSSGGAVVDYRGGLVGIATSALSRIAGLAIPAESVDRVVNALLEKGRVPRGYFGMGVQPVAIPEGLRSSLSLANKSGMMIVNVEPGGPADKAGILLGDIVVSLEDANIEEIEDLLSFSDADVIGKPVRARIIRSGRPQYLTMTAGERPEK
jgi:S1-C subfamily serine protease